jgi:hypothetical protein
MTEQTPLTASEEIQLSMGEVIAREANTFAQAKVDTLEKAKAEATRQPYYSEMSPGQQGQLVHTIRDKMLKEAAEAARARAEEALGDYVAQVESRKEQLLARINDTSGISAEAILKFSETSDDKLYDLAQAARNSQQLQHLVYSEAIRRGHPDVRAIMATCYDLAAELEGLPENPQAKAAQQREILASQLVIP